MASQSSKIQLRTITIIGAGAAVLAVIGYLLLKSDRKKSKKKTSSHSHQYSSNDVLNSAKLNNKDEQGELLLIGDCDDEINETHEINKLCDLYNKKTVNCVKSTPMPQSPTPLSSLSSPSPLLVLPSPPLASQVIKPQEPLQSSSSPLENNNNNSINCTLVISGDNDNGCNDEKLKYDGDEAKLNNNEANTQYHCVECIVNQNDNFNNNNNNNNNMGQINDENFDLEKNTYLMGSNDKSILNDVSLSVNADTLEQVKCYNNNNNNNSDNDYKKSQQLQQQQQLLSQPSSPKQSNELLNDKLSEISSDSGNGNSEIANNGNEDDHEHNHHHKQKRSNKRSKNSPSSNSISSDNGNNLSSNCNTSNMNEDDVEINTNENNQLANKQLETTTSTQATSSSTSPSTSTTTSAIPQSTSSMSISSSYNDQDIIIYEFHFPRKYCGKLIGRNGVHVDYIRDKTHVQIAVSNDPNVDDLQIVCLTGCINGVDQALDIISARFPSRYYPQITFKPITKPIIYRRNRVENNKIIVSPNMFVPLTPIEIATKNGKSDQNCQLDVHVSAIVSTTHLFIQLPLHPTYLALQRLDEDMLHAYNTNDKNIPNLSCPIEYGTICAAPTSYGWHRAMVVEYYVQNDATQATNFPYYNDEIEMATIKFLDYGGYLNIPVNQLKQLRSDFMALPFQAIEVFLDGITTIEEHEEDGKNLISKLIKNYPLKAIITGYTQNNIPLVKLFQVTDSFKVCQINTELVANGFANSIINA